jgi:hypothetical protein
MVRATTQLFGRFKCYPICLRLNPEIRATTSKQFYFFTSTFIRRLFWFGRAEGAIEKMRSIFFRRSKSSAGAGCAALPAVEANLRYTVLSELFFRTAVVRQEPEYIDTTDFHSLVFGIDYGYLKMIDA